MPDTKTTVEPLEEVSDEDLEDLCDAAESAILDGGGFGWLKPPPRAVLGRYFRGVILVPERHLFVGRLGQRVVAAIQLQEPPRNNEALAHAANLTALFVALGSRTWTRPAIGKSRRKQGSGTWLSSPKPRFTSNPRYCYKSVRALWF